MGIAPTSDISASIPDWTDRADVRAHATAALKAAVGSDEADFRDGQWEAIEQLTLDGGRLLVVQRTGWGKSSVYFMTTRLLRQRGRGPTILLSPLLALMRDQIRSAERFGLRAVSIDSTNRDDWDDLTDAVLGDEVDVLLVSPERLANNAFRQRVLEPLLPRIGMFVIDEAHCISDWGHDFRPDYRRIGPILDRLPASVPVLATTATATDAVVADVTSQLGAGVRSLRGSLARPSLHLQSIGIASEAGRLAWLGEFLPEMPGSGIVYTLTRGHAERVAGWLRGQGIKAEAYIGGGKLSPARREELEQQLLDNDVKALVATPALGMGFDKPDLRFVAHFQMPQSIIHYYQQVGRAGRSGEPAHGVLLHGDGDRRIIDFFANRALPSPDQFALVEETLLATKNGLTPGSIAKRTKLGKSLVDQVLRHMAVMDPPPVESVSGGSWRTTGGDMRLDTARMEALSLRRSAELAIMEDYTREQGCLMRFLTRALDDPATDPCGCCVNCSGTPLHPAIANAKLEQEAAAFDDGAAAGGARGRGRGRRKAASGKAAGGKSATTTTRRGKTKRRSNGAGAKAGTTRTGASTRTVARTTAIGYVDQAIVDGESSGRERHIVDELIALRCELADGKGGRFDKAKVLGQIGEILR